MQALRFDGPATTPSTSNDLDYVLTSGAATFRNNNTDTYTIVEPTGVALPGLAFASEPRFVPNPFRSSTKLVFNLRKAAHTRLIITSVSGRQIGRREAVLPAGFHSFDWSATDLGVPIASGAYFYRLEAGEEVRTGQVVLLR